MIFMNLEWLKDFPKEVTDKVPTPCYLINEEVIKRNLEIIKKVKEKSKAKVLLALKAYALPVTFPLISKYLDGVNASGPHEARLGREEFKKEVHTFAPAYSDEDISELIKYSDVIIFNSIWQLKRYRDIIKSSKKDIQIGIRINPGYSEVKNKLYDPVAPGSRLGIQPEELNEDILKEIDGFHFHALFEQDSYVLERVLTSFEKKVGKYISKVKWVNFGGGHLITKPGYNIEHLSNLIINFKEKYNTQVYLEPGEAVVLNAGVLVSKVLDIVKNEIEIAILDTSAETHMPDVLAAPYRPEIIGAGKPYELPYTYRLGGISCLAGDIIGDYSFPQPLRRGDRIVFLDMAHYSFVKNTTFNGIKLPSLILYSPEKKEIKIIREFGYEDYKRRIS